VHLCKSSRITDSFQPLNSNPFDPPGFRCSKLLTAVPTWWTASALLTSYREGYDDIIPPYATPKADLMDSCAATVILLTSAQVVAAVSDAHPLARRYFAKSCCASFG